MKFSSRILADGFIALVLIILIGCTSAPSSVSRSDSVASVSNSPAVDASNRVVAVVSPPPIPTTAVSAETDQKIVRAQPEVIPSARVPVSQSVAIEDNPKLNSRASGKPPAKPTATLSAISPRPFADADLYLHLPPIANQGQPLRVLYVLHGMGGQGAHFAQSLIAEADRNNWLIVAPNFAYRDYMDLAQLAEDDITLTKRMADTLESLPKRLNLKLSPRVLVYGFSRGAQLGHRFALLYPDQVSSVAAMSAGAYTLPLEVKNTEKGSQRLPFPFGAGDVDKWLGHPVGWSSFKRVSFWIGVGDKDNCTTDVPRAFDQYIGNNRLERARAFEQTLRAQGVDARLAIFPNVGHEVTGDMRKNALQFLRERETKTGFSD